jgi:hypothetical protein
MRLRATGEALPGLLRAQDVSHFRGIAERIRNIDEANAQKREFEEAQKAKEQIARIKAEVPLMKGMSETMQPGNGPEPGSGSSISQ